MKPNQRSFLVAVSVLAALALDAPQAASQTVPGVPEPGLILYGQVRNAATGNNLLTYGILRWTLTPSAGAPITVSSTLTNINDQFSYEVRVPFETVLAGFTLSSGALALSGSPTTFTRSATVSATSGGSPQLATNLPPALGTFTFGAADRGRLERVDLQVSLAFVDTDGDGLDDNWERVYLVDLRYGASDDPDGDGMENSDEQKAGTNPNDPQSRFAFIAIARDPTEGIGVRWSSVALNSYSVQRSGNLTSGFTNLEISIAATPGTNYLRDATATGPGPYFYRIRVE